MTEGTAAGQIAFSVLARRVSLGGCLMMEIAMRAGRRAFLRLVIGGLSGGLVLAEAAVLQASAQEPARQQRAPGVPLAPNPSTIYQDESRGKGKPGIDAPPPKLDAPQERAAERGAQRKLPMPRPVPSIIAPGAGP